MRWSPLLYAAAAMVLLTLFPTSTAAAQQGSTVQVNVDSPAAGSSIVEGEPIFIGGWAVDTALATGPGVDEVEVWLDGPRRSGRRLEVDQQTPRPDIVQSYGRPDWGGSGFATGLRPWALDRGQHTLYLYAHSTRGEWATSTVSFSVVAPDWQWIPANVPNEPLPIRGTGRSCEGSPYIPWSKLGWTPCAP